LLHNLICFSVANHLFKHWERINQVALILLVDDCLLFKSQFEKTKQVVDPTVAQLKCPAGPLLRKHPNAYLPYNEYVVFFIVCILMRLISFQSSIIKQVCCFQCQSISIKISFTIGIAIIN
jgi:hypothetical protein